MGKEKIVPSLATTSITVVDSVCCHRKQAEKVPINSSLKKEMLEYYEGTQHQVKIHCFLISLKDLSAKGDSESH
jgi:hypothetical protein